jgi:hypothetical protein
VGKLNVYGDRHWAFLSYGLFFCVSVAIFSTFLDYGLTFDEEFGKLYGEYVLRWYSTLFQDQSALSYYNLCLYGGFFEALSQLIVSMAQKVSPIGLYETRHLVNALFGLLGIFYAYKLGAHLAGSCAGFFSALFLTLTPAFYGQMFNDSKDVPFAALFSFALYCIFRTYSELPRVSARLTVALGVAMGLALGVRVGGVILVGYLALFWLGWLSLQWARGLCGKREFLIVSTRLACTFIFAVAIAWTVMLIWWPWAQVSPLRHPLHAMKATAHFKWGLTVFFDGRFIAGSALPWTYLPTWLIISLPEFYFIALPLGLLACKSGTIFDKDASHQEWSIKIALLLFAACFPVVAALMLHSTMYDGMRQFLFVLVSIATLAGISFAKFLKSGVNRLIKIGAGGLILLSAILTSCDMVQMHPYEYIYFNRLFAGGVKSAAQRFETDYWGSSYKEGVEWLINNYRPDSTKAIRVANCEILFIIKYFFDKKGFGRFLVVKPQDNPDVYLGITRWQCHKMIEGKLIHTVQRKGIPLLYIMEVHGLYRPEVSRMRAD